MWKRIKAFLKRRKDRNQKARFRGKVGPSGDVTFNGGGLNITKSDIEEIKRLRRESIDER
ncbi:MAG: hypothetical protein CMF22_11715 [Idiomarinaceae bacterium]|nr:hypothetical protein [Idiomarinaceae bacterium]|tara:strand:- start:167 stop:346 length:180 start_codon:yes stop_codon:yes gene_type:complete